MIRTKDLTSELNDVPTEWVYEYYLNLTEKLCGQDVRIKSIFKADDNTPSMFIYWSRTLNRYRYKDFSTGESGDGVSLVQNLLKLTTRGEAAHKIIRDYNKFISDPVNHEDYKLREFQLQEKYRVTDFAVREWTNVDQKYWTRFKISSHTLKKFNVKPLAFYTMTKEVGGELLEIKVENKNFVYGYFREDGTLYKIYQPMMKETKFIKVREYIQGTDQLTYKSKYLVILSSLKDGMAFTELKYKDVEIVAPDSENVLIPAHIINSYRLKYKGIAVIFDNDQAGIKAMNEDENEYNICGVLLPLEKDLSDSIEKHGLLDVKKGLTPILKHALNNFPDTNSPF